MNNSKQSLSNMQVDIGGIVLKNPVMAAFP